MRIAIASLIQESNTFSPVPTRIADLHPVYGPDVLTRHRGKLTEMGGFLDVLDGTGAEIIPLGAAWSVTQGRVVRADLDALIDQYLRQWQGPVDGLLIAMHGAQTAEGIDDVEGYFLGRLREVAGPDVPLIVTLDLHANVTQRMIDQATAIIGYRTYPHIDMFEIGQAAARLLLRTLEGNARPVLAWRKLPLILNAEHQQTTHGPMAAMRAWADELVAEQGLLAASLFPVQPWLDIEEMGCAVVVVGDGDRAAAAHVADQLARRLWNEREVYKAQLTPVEEAVAQASTMEGPVVLAESSDSTGSGSPGDSTGVLRPLLQARLQGPAAIFVVDPAAVAAAFAAGVGGRVQTPVGGCFDRIHSTPVEVDGYVRLLSDGRWTARARGYNTGIETCMGRTAVVETGEVKILIAERSAMTVDPELFRSHGIAPEYCQIVVVKSPNGFRAAYEPLAKGIFLVDTPGVSTANLSRLPWQRIARPIYPLDAQMPDPVFE